MESHETLDSVQEMKITLKEILNVLKDIKEDFKNTASPVEAITVTRGDNEFLEALQVINNNEIKATKPTKKAKDNVATN